MLHSQFDAFFCRTICLWPQNTLQFSILLLHWSQISFPGAFFWCLQTASSCWGPNLENSKCNSCSFAIVAIDFWHGALSWWKSTFFFLICGRFWWFIPSNTPIMLYDIHYWWFFLSQGNCAFQNTKAKTFPANFASLVSLDSFHLLLSIQLTANLTLEWSGGSIFYPLLHIYAKTPFCCVETVVNNVLNRQCVVVFDQLWANAPSTLNTAFSLTNVHAKWWMHCLLIYSTPLLSHAISIYVWPKWVFGVFQDNCWTWATWVFSIISVCMIAFKVSIPPLNHCFKWNRVWITLIKPLLCLNSIFSHQKAMLYQHTKFRFFHFFENLQQ